jgi:hypothetical protein
MVAKRDFVDQSFFFDLIEFLFLYFKLICKTKHRTGKQVLQ